MQWKKDPSMKYTDICIWIDQNLEKLRVPYEYPEIEDKLYNYLWLLVKALAIKKGMFSNFQDYDPYAFYAANRLFFAFRRNLWNAGQTIKGKHIRPIKSSLNYTKALLYPMKIEYQQEAFREVVSEDLVNSKFNAFSYNEKLKESARDAQGVNEWFATYVYETFKNCGSLVDKVLKKSPFGPDSLEYKWLKISILLNCISIVKTKKRLDTNILTVTLWKLPKSMSNYVRILLKEFIVELKLEIMDCYKTADVDDATLSALVITPNKEAIEFNED